MVARLRFLREARLAARLRHSNVASVLHLGRTGSGYSDAQEGRLREASLQALLRELAAFNTGLCVITTRTPIADIADYERSSVANDSCQLRRARLLAREEPHNSGQLDTHPRYRFLSASMGWRSSRMNLN
jgi:hypothetical protein